MGGGCLNIYVYLNESQHCNRVCVTLQWHWIRSIFTHPETHADPEEVGAPNSFFPGWAKLTDY